MHNRHWQLRLRPRVVAGAMMALLAAAGLCYVVADGAEAPEVGRTLEMPRHADLGVLMTELLSRCLAACREAQAEVSEAAKGDALARRRDKGMWVAVKRSPRTVLLLVFESETGPVRQADKRVYAKEGSRQQVAGAGYAMFWKAGRLGEFIRVPSTETLIFHPNGAPKFYCVPLSKTRTYEAEWDKDGKLVCERIRTAQ